MELVSIPFFSSDVRVSEFVIERRGKLRLLVKFPVMICAWVLPIITCLGQLLSSYGYWSYAAHTSSEWSSWFPITVIVAGCSLLGWLGLAFLYHAVKVGVASFVDWWNCY
jgi:hypothetical protein